MANCYGSLPGSCGQRFGFHDMGTAGNSTGLGEQRRWSFSGFENRGGWGNRMMSSEGAPLGYQGPSNPHFTGCWQEPQNSWQVGVSPGQQGRSSQGWQNQQADWYQNPHNHGTPENLQMLGGRQPSKMDAWAGSEKDNGSFSRCVEGQGNKYGKSEVPRWDMAERDEMKRCDQRSCDKLPDGSEMCSQEDRLSDEQLAKVISIRLHFILTLFLSLGHGVYGRSA